LGRIVEEAQRLRLASRIPHFDNLVRSCTGGASPLQHFLTQRITAVVQEATGHIEHPVLPAGLSSYTGPVGLLVEKATQRLLGVTPRTLCGHILITGPSGRFKTTLAGIIASNARLIQPNVQVSYLDIKEDWRGDAYRNPQCLLAWRDLPLNILRPPTFLPKDLYNALLLDTLLRSHWGAHHQHRILTLGLQAAREKTDDPNWEDVVNGIKSLRTTHASFQQRDAIDTSCII